MSDQEKRNNRIGILASVGIHATMFLALLFLVAWRAPNPPLPEYGIELNFGLDEQGSGEVQPENSVGQETGEETGEEAQAEAQPESKPEVKETEQVEEPAKSDQAAVSKTESPVATKEEKKETVVVKEKKDKPAESKPVEKLEAEYKKKDDAAITTAKKGEEASHGDDKKTGDKGNPEGTLEPKALYGTPGGGGGGDGMELSMNGWAWAEKPQIPDLPDNENGRVIFEIDCDQDGEIIGLRTIERSLSPKAEQLLKEEIRKNSLVKLSEGQAPAKSTGRITFVLRTK